MTSRTKSPKATARKHAFHVTMTQARSHMNVVMRIFSRLIHLRCLDTVIEFIGATALRPQPLIGGLLGMSALLALFYGVAKYFGYDLSGFEGIAGFLIGWVIGAIVEFAQLLRGPQKK